MSFGEHRAHYYFMQYLIIVNLNALTSGLQKNYIIVIQNSNIFLSLYR